MTATARTTTAVAMLGVAGAWNGGNVGPVASEIAAEFDISLAVVGILAGTLFLGSCAVGLVFAAQVGARLGLANGARLACGLFLSGNLIFAVSPVFAGLALGRVLPGLGFALMNTLGAVWAREAGGVRLLGVFGASIQFGLALSLLTGSVLSDIGADWRAGFLLSAVVGAAALAAIPAGAKVATADPGRRSGFIRAAVRRARVYRLSLMFMAIYGVPMVLSAWLVEYLAREGDVATALAGAAAFLLFGLSAAARVFGAGLQKRGLPHRLLAGALGLAAAGLAALALDPTAALAFAAVAVLGIGFGIPYSTALSEAQELFPADPAEPVALMSLLAIVPPVAAIPLFGHALSRGDGELAVWLLAGFLVIATLANLRRTGIPLTDAGSGRPGGQEPHLGDRSP